MRRSAQNRSAQNRSGQSPARMAVLLAVGLLAAGPLGGCGSHQGPAAPTPPTGTSGPAGTAPSLPAAAPLPLPLPQPQPSTGPPRPEPGLGAQDRARLLQARRVGAPWVVLLVSTTSDGTSGVAAGIQHLGGVLGTNPGPGFLRATVPTGNVEQVAALPGVEGITVEQVIPPNTTHPTG